MNNYADLLQANINTPLGACNHWIKYGRFEGRQAHAGFSSKQYLAYHSDLSAAFGPTNYSAAIDHWIYNGINENRIGYVGGGFEDRATIRGKYGNSYIYVSGSNRTAGAIDSVMWDNAEYINSYDHGRQLQIALAQNGYGECYNPTEAGRSQDNLNKNSSSLLTVFNAQNSIVSTSNIPAFWFAPGIRQHCGIPKNTTVRAENFRFNKTVQVGYAGIPNVIRFNTQVAILNNKENMPTVGGYSFHVEAPTGYLGGEFSKISSFDPAFPSNPLQSLENQAQKCHLPNSGLSCEQNLPVIFEDNKGHAMGVCAVGENPALFQPITYAVFSFITPYSPINSTTKWAVVQRYKPTAIGPLTLNFKTNIAVGTLADVKAAMVRLYQTGECFRG